MWRALALATVFAAATANADTLIHAGTLIDGSGDEPRANVTLRIDGTRIRAIEDGFIPGGADDTVIDLSTMTVLPGFIDLHTHLSSELSRTSYQERFTLNDADFALKAYGNGIKTLHAGFTTVRDLGDMGNVTISLRDAIARGQLDGPRIFTAATSLATTGGHADPTNGWARKIAGDPAPINGVVNGPADARKAVRQRYKERADWIKITATGGVLSLAKNGQNPQFSDAELTALIETANDYDLKVAAHAHGTEGMLRAIRAGVTTIEHGTYMTPEVMREMRRRGTYYVPTILAGVWVGELAQKDGMLPAVVRPKAAAIGPQIQDTFASAVKAGVPIAFGTDSGVSPHGMNAREFQLMVEAGMTPMDAIRSATAIAARVLGAENDFGTLEAGKLADVVAVNGDPLANIERLQSIAFVMKEGRVFKH
ncbi:MAG: amidohydrolase family protein [Pseudomonadota bacterium]